MIPTPLRWWYPQSLRFGLLFFVGCILLLPARSVAVPKQTLADLPLQAQAAIAAALGKDQPAYHAKHHGAGFTFNNPRHDFTATLTTKGLALTQRKSALTLQLTRYGYGTPSQPLRLTKPIARENRVEYRRGALTEWYVNGPLGLEQGFTLNAAPSVRRIGPLTLALSLSWDVTPRVDSTRTAATLLSRTGEARLRYTGLTVIDATGATLPAWLTADGSRLLIQVDDARARYPLTIDPFIQQAKLTASDGAQFDEFGSSVAIDSDTVVVGAKVAGIGGAAYVFTRAGSVWIQTAKLTASDGAAGDLFGISVAINGDTVVVGASSATIGANTFQGAAYIFVQPVSGWTTMTQTAKLTASDGAVGDLFGISVAINGDTVVVGAGFVDIGADINQGAAYVLVKPGSGWTTMTETAKLTASDGVVSDEFGWSVAINGDTVVVGAGFADDVGAAYVFVKPGSGWATTSAFTAKLTASDGAFDDYFGSSVAINGDTVVVGAPWGDIGPNPDQGAAYVFVKPVTGWADMTQTAKLTASDGAPGDEFGNSVAISGDRAVVAAWVHVDRGAAYVFIKPPGGWATMTESAKLIASDRTAFDFGVSVAIDSNSVVVGADWTDIGDNFGQGATYVYHFYSPDLTGRWLNLSQTCRSTRAGQRCRLTGAVELTNQGDGKAPTSSFLRFYLSEDATFDPATDTFLRQVAVGALRSGMSQRKTLSVPLPAGQNATGMVVLAVIDATDRIVESDKTNNLLVFGPLP